MEGKTAAPLRCFLGNIARCITQQQQQRSAVVVAKPWNRNNVVSNKRHKVEPLPVLRLMGTVVDLKTIDKAIDNNREITLDDGTGIVRIQATHAMIVQIHVHAGMTLDCIVRVEQSSDETPTFALIADQLVVVQDMHAETLRWLELSYQNSNKQAVEMQWGFPTRQISSDDIYRIIVSECQDDGSVTLDGKAPPQKPKGVSREDIAECLDLSLARVESLIQELQHSGQIYRNAEGLFLPL